MKIVSIHVQKTAGSSFGRSLKNHFGENYTKRNDQPILNNFKSGKSDFYYEFPVVHGHFLPKHFRFPDKYVLVTWLRNPVDRVVSHYNFWKNHFIPPKFPKGNLHWKLVNEDMSLMEFVSHPLIANLYTRWFSGFPLSQFSFVGITEHYSEDFKRFCKECIGTILPEVRENVSPNPMKISEHMRKEIEDWNRNDMEMYELANHMRNIDIGNA